MNKIIKKILVIETGGFLISFITVISILWVFSNNLPDYKFLKNYKAPVSSKVNSDMFKFIVSPIQAHLIFFLPNRIFITP